MHEKVRSGADSAAESPRRGFTLVELLVVIGIIALLIAILLPALHAAKLRAQAVACASNMKQIYMAMAMFAGENKDHLPRTYGVGELSSDPVLVKVCAWLQKMTNAAGHIDLDDNKGALWSSLRGKTLRSKVLMCPGDSGEALAGHTVDPKNPRNFSYSMNSLIRRDSGGPRLGLQLSKVRNSSERIMLYEELAPNDTNGIMGMKHKDDVPSGRHGKSMRDSFRNDPTSPGYYTAGLGNHCFFDGHVELLTPGSLLPPKGRPQYHFPLIAGDRTTFP